MAAEILQLMPGMNYEQVGKFYWEQLKDWHTVAVRTAKRIRGLE